MSQVISVAPLFWPIRGAAPQSRMNRLGKTSACVTLKSGSRCFSFLNPCGFFRTRQTNSVTTGGSVISGVKWMMNDRVWRGRCYAEHETVSFMFLFFSRAPFFLIRVGVLISLTSKFGWLDYAEERVNLGDLNGYLLFQECVAFEPLLPANIPVRAQVY